MASEARHQQLWFALCLVAMACVSGAFVPENTADIIPLCPPQCECNLDTMVALCNEKFGNYTMDTLLPWELLRLNLLGDVSMTRSLTPYPGIKSVILKTRDVDTSLYSKEQFKSVFAKLKYLTINFVPISDIAKGDFLEMPELVEIDLSYSNISDIQPGAFTEQTKVQVLNLEGNEMSHIQENVFQGLQSLKTLNLNRNNLKSLTPQTFLGLSITQLYLRDNNLRHVESLVLGLKPIQMLDLSGNKIQYISNDSVGILRRVQSVDLSRNPFQCSCAIFALISAVQTNTSLHSNAVQCAGPSPLEGVNFESLDTADLPCSLPTIEMISPQTNVLYHQSVQLECNSEGDGPVVNYWLTPWGDTYTHQSTKDILPKDSAITNGTIKHDNEYSGVNLPLTSRVYATESGALHIDTFRGIFAGNFTCVAVNVLGQSNKTVEVGISSMMTDIYFDSLFIGAYCAGGLFVLAVVIGAIRLFVNKCLHSEGCNCCCCNCEDVDEMYKKTEGIEVTIEDGEVVTDTYDYTMEDSDYDPDPGVGSHHSDTPPDPPVNSPLERLSPDKIHTPNSDTLDDKNAPLWDQLDEVRARLRYGAGRKIEKVRSSVRSTIDTGSIKIRNIKDAGNLKIQSIKETSSHAATIVRKNIAGSLVQVKYGVQSIKEFCGTGELGGTISMVSVSTDVDTKEQVTIVRSHTFV